MKIARKVGALLTLAALLCTLFAATVFAAENGSLWAAVEQTEGTAALIVTDTTVTDGVVKVTYDSSVLAYESTEVTAEYVLDDVNADGVIDILDAKLVVSYYNELTDLTDLQLLAADVNGDGAVNILDANLIAGCYNKLPEEHKHSYSSKVTAPTCTADGYTTYTCACGDSYTEAIPKTGHSWGDWKVTKEPTTEAEGQETRTCSTCGATENRAVEKLPSNTCTSHEYTWVCDSSDEFDTGTCKNCGTTKVIYASSSTTSQAVMDAINAYRKANGLNELTWWNGANTIIRMRATEIKEVQLSHARPDGSQEGSAECIGAGYGNAQAVVDAWYNSSSHNGTIMDADAAYIAAACNGSYWVVWIG